MDNPFFSKGIFSWNVPGVDGGDPNKFADRLKAAGFEAVYLKMANGAAIFKPNIIAYPTWGENVRQALVDALRARGIKVIGWQFNYGDNIAGEASVAIAQTQRFNVDGWIFDVESRFESNTAAVANAYALTNAYREKCPNTPLAFCSWAQWRSPTSNTLWHNENVASAFMEKCDVGMPMMYWEGSTPAMATWLLNESARLWQNITNKPLIPTGRAYTGDGGTIGAAAISAFAEAAKAKGMKGISWWVLDSAIKDSAAWGALAATPKLAQYTVYLPVVITPPAVDPHLAQLENIRNELGDLRARIAADLTALQQQAAAVQSAALALQTHAGNELDYIIGLTE